MANGLKIAGSQIFIIYLVILVIVIVRVTQTYVEGECSYCLLRNTVLKKVN